MLPASDLFPDIAPFEHGMLAVGDGHEIYWEQVGNPDGPPLLFLHGGPGAGCGAIHRRFFDPRYWRVILFDQRGAGRSRPLGAIEANTTPHLVADIEALRAMLDIPAWVLFGGSWGSTLTLAYAQAHGERVRAMVLRGIFLGRPQEIDWFMKGIAQVFPDAHEQFLSVIDPAERDDPLEAYRRRLFDESARIHMPAARSWCAYEARCSTLLPGSANVTHHSSDATILALARIEVTYFCNALFLPPQGILAGMADIGGIPGIIVQGRYDMVCPSYSAWDLAKAWPGGRLKIIADAGHSAMEPGIRRALIAATEQFRAR